MSAWICWTCKAHGEGDVDICPKCGPGEARLTIWLCCECWSEGTGERPAECPACGCPDSWFVSSTDPGDPRPARAIYQDVMMGLLGPSKRKH